MSTKRKLDEILGIIQHIMDDDKRLTKVLEFLEDEILSEDDFQPENYLEKVPEKFKESIRQIADNMNANLISFFNPETLEIDFYHKDAWAGRISPEDDEDAEFDEDWDDPTLKWENCIDIEPLEAHESFTIMSRFVAQLKDKEVAELLSCALNKAKPFANFNHIIHNSNYRQQWFDFRQQELENYVINNYFGQHIQETD